MAPSWTENTYYKDSKGNVIMVIPYRTFRLGSIDPSYTRRQPKLGSRTSTGTV